MTTQQPRHSEPSANNELGDLLRGMLYGCKVISENTQLIVGQPSLQLDNLIVGPDRAPVVVEAEYEALGTAEGDAKARLGLEVVDETHTIEASIALRYPDTVRFADNLRESLSSAHLKYAVFYDDEDSSRFPESGWLEGSVTDLADLIRLVSVPQKAVNAAADALQKGIDRAATILNQMAERRPGISTSIAGLLGMADVEQTRRMAAAILANALVFHERIAGMHDGVESLELVCGPEVSNPKSATLAAWGTILNINYWPIFAIARDVLAQLPAREAKNVFDVLRDTVEEFDSAGVNHSHDLTGRIFQRLIADRKYLATFYTRPSSAALLARVAVSKMDVDWSDSEAIGELRIGDFACGTGALLSAVYDQISARHERTGGDPGALHTKMMEEVLYGCDVMPSAVHITGSTLSGAHPDVQFGQSRLYTLAYGRQEDGSVKIGSLELLQSSAVMTLFNTSDPALQTGSVGEQTAAQVIADVGDSKFDLVIMNPPFTRATNHEGAHADITNPAFAAFDASRADQTAMGARINRLGKGTCYHGNAGIASGFVALADKKLKPGGVLALVLPLAAAAGLSWRSFRRMLSEHYSEVEVFSIAEAISEPSFSSDTGMAECLVIAKKVESAGSNLNRAGFVSLSERPLGLVGAAALASASNSTHQARKIEDGPYGGTPLIVGEETSGNVVLAPLSAAGANWGNMRLMDYAVAQTAYALAGSKLWLPGQSEAIDLVITQLGDVAALGLVHRDITGPAPRGPFDKVAPSPTATYPALWSHNAKKETRIVCQPRFAVAGPSWNGNQSSRSLGDCQLFTHPSQL